MAEGYCVKCKAKKEIVDAVEAVMKNGRKAIKGKCPDCATTMFKILGGAATSNASDSAETEESTTPPFIASSAVTSSTLPPITGSGGAKSGE